MLATRLAFLLGSIGTPPSLVASLLLSLALGAVAVDALALSRRARPIDTGTARSAFVLTLRADLPREQDRHESQEAPRARLDSESPHADPIGLGADLSALKQDGHPSGEAFAAEDLVVKV